MKLTLNISDNATGKATALIEYLKSLDFLTVVQEEDFTVPDWHKQIVQDRVKNSSPDQRLDWDKIKNSFKLD